MKILKKTNQLLDTEPKANISACGYDNTNPGGGCGCDNRGDGRWGDCNCDD